jgi:two-component system, cell cycle sensor histidine kinase and response regulator CckA
MTLPGNRQTILVVEDDPATLHLVQRILERGNYEVLCANSAKEGERIGKEFPRPIDLLLADVVMPHMIGPDLATRLIEQRPAMHVILMSGYPDAALPVLNDGWPFIRKPFVPRALLEKIEAVFNRTTVEPGTDHFDARVAETLSE